MELSKIKKTIIILITLLFGFIPMFISAILTDSFIGNKYDLPMIFNISIMFGDLVLLPIFNIKFVELFYKNKKNIITKKYKTIGKIILVSLLSACINLYSHFILWPNDNITGFMDFHKGELAIGGWVHFFFSFLQMIIVFYYLIELPEIIKANKSNKLIRSLQKLLIIFVLLQIPDFILRNIKLNTINNFIGALLTDWPSVAVPIVMIAYFTFLQIKYRK